MDNIETVKTCPLNSECKTVRGDTIYTCRWWVELKGTDAQGNTTDRGDCAIAWLPTLLLENSSKINSLGAVAEGHRNQVAKVLGALSSPVNNIPKISRPKASK